MRADLRDTSRRPLGRVEIDVVERPTRVQVPGTDREVFLAWEGALDDAGHLRRCVACGCQGMFRTKSFPQITVIVVILAFAGAIVAALGYAADPKVLVAMVAVLLLDVGILVFSHPLLVCYRCRSTYRDLPIARYHRRWDSREAEKWSPDAGEAATGPRTVTSPRPPATPAGE